MVDNPERAPMGYNVAILFSPGNMSAESNDGASKSEATTEGRHVLDGEYRHKDILYSRYFPLEVLEKIPDIEFKSDDVILTTYPKCGE